MRQLADEYFQHLRIEAAISCGECSELDVLDSLFQDLLQLSHHSSTVGKYQDTLKAAHSTLVRLDGLATTRRPGPTASNTAILPVDTLVISTLRAIAPSASLSYNQALLDLQQSTRHSWRGPATDLRESLRETLDYLAPDKEVTAAPGFKFETDQKSPTMKQKVRFVLRQREVGNAVAGTTEQAVEAVEAVLGTFVRSVYTRSNVSTHTPTDKGEVLRVRDLVRVSLCELLEIRV